MLKNQLLYLLISISLFSCAQENIQFSEARPVYKSISPLVSELLEIEEQNLPAKLDQFWEEVQQQGLPRIEEDPSSSDYAWLTFIYRDHRENREISFEVFGMYGEYRWGDMKMHRLGSSDLYYRSYMIPNDLCFSYRYIVEDSLSNKLSHVPDQYNKDRIPRGDEKSFSYSVLDLRDSETDWNAQRYPELNSTIDTLEYSVKTIDKDRNMYVYLPPNYDEKREKPYPVVYLFDAFIYLNRVEVPNILDNLITEEKIEPTIAVLFGTHRTSRRIILPLNTAFKDEFISDVLPLVRSKYNTSLDPQQNIIGGMSYGGLAAAYMAFEHPNVFGKVLSQSGSFWRDKNLCDQFGNEVRNDWLINQFHQNKTKDLKLFLDWGLQENLVLGSNRKMVEVLHAKDYDFKYEEFNGWHDWSNSRKTFPKGLLYLMNEK